jgi:hypothetical protein
MFAVVVGGESECVVTPRKATRVGMRWETCDVCRQRSRGWSLGQWKHKTRP